MESMEKTKRMDYRFDKMIITLMLICIGIIVSVTFHFPQITSALFAVSFVVLLVMVVKIIYMSVFRSGVAVDFFIMLFMFMLSFMFLVISGSGLMSFRYMRKFYMFAATLLFIFVSGIINIKTETKKAVLSTGLILAIFYTVMYYSGNGEYLGRYLTFGHSNSNLAGMWLLSILMLLIMCPVYFKNKLLKLVSIAEIPIIVYFITLTQSRNCLLVAITFPIMYLIVKFVRCHVKIEQNRKIFVMLIILIPLIFSLLYLFLVNNNLIAEQIELVITSEGKNITSRMGIWERAFGVIKDHPITGGYYDLGGRSGWFQMHNMAVDTCAAYGIPVYILFVILMVRIFSKAINDCNNKFELLLISAEFTMFNTGIGEAGLLGGTVGMYILACSFLLLIDKKHETS